jgi:hypothetical protein
VRLKLARGADARGVDTSAFGPAAPGQGSLHALHTPWTSYPVAPGNEAIDPASLAPTFEAGEETGMSAESTTGMLTFVVHSNSSCDRGVSETPSVRRVILERRYVYSSVGTARAALSRRLRLLRFARSLSAVRACRVSLVPLACAPRPAVQVTEWVS